MEKLLDMYQPNSKCWNGKWRAELCNNRMEVALIAETLLTQLRKNCAGAKMIHSRGLPSVKQLISMRCYRQRREEAKNAFQG